MKRKLTLISAPAGFGKTTLLSDWVQRIKQPSAWLTLEENDNNLIQFMKYFVAALQQIKENVGIDILAALERPQVPPTDILLTRLINEINDIDVNFVFILDDYHVIDNQSVHDVLGFFLNHLPQNMHLIVTGRVDPSLPIARIRAEGQMTEIRSDDLRFIICRYYLFRRTN